MNQSRAKKNTLSPLPKVICTRLSVTIIFYLTYSTICPRSSDLFYTVSHYMKWSILLGHTVCCVDAESSLSLIFVQYFPDEWAALWIKFLKSMRCDVCRPPQYWANLQILSSLPSSLLMMEGRAIFLLTIALSHIYLGTSY